MLNQPKIVSNSTFDSLLEFQLTIFYKEKAELSSLLENFFLYLRPCKNGISNGIPRIVPRYAQFLTGPIVNLLRYFEDCAVLEVAHVGNEYSSGQHHPARQGKDNRIKVIGRDYLSTTSFPIWAHISTSQYE